MGADIQLYRGAGFVPAESIQLLPLIVQNAAKFLGRDLGDQEGLRIELINLPDSGELNNVPLIYNLVPEYGYAQVTVFHTGRVLYRHPHPLHQLIAAPLQDYLREKYPTESQWGYRIVAPGLPAGPTIRPTPVSPGSFQAGGGEPALNLVMSRQPPPRPRPARLGDFGIASAGPDEAARLKVLLHRNVADAFQASRSFSSQFEDGGFLIGRVYEDADCENGHFVVVSEAPVAEYTGASMLHFTFTGDSFSTMKRRLREGGDEDRIVGWYHTHLFAATDAIGLSSVDFQLHFSTFTNPWQIAGLINLDGRSRTLRFYRREGERMQLCPYWTIEG